MLLNDRYISHSVDDLQPPSLPKFLATPLILGSYYVETLQFMKNVNCILLTTLELLLFGIFCCEALLEQITITSLLNPRWQLQCNIRA